MNPVSDKRPDESLVSVVIIFLNEEKFLEDAIQSVLAQTYQNWELLLVDDGSHDSSTTLALTYARHCPGKIRYLDHQGHRNRGMSTSRNLGIANARGKYIAMLDADDVWLPTKLQDQVAILDSHTEAAMVYGATQYWYSWTGNPSDFGRDIIPNLRIKADILVEPPRLLVLYLKGKATVPCLSCDMLLRRESLADIGGFDEVFTGPYEDQAFLAKVCLKAPIFVSSKCWDKYRLHPNSCCSVTANQKRTRATRLFYLNWLANYLVAERIENREIWRALKHELWLCEHPLLRCVMAKHLARVMMRPFRSMMHGLFSPFQQSHGGSVEMISVEQKMDA